MSAHTDFLLLLQNSGHSLASIGLREVGLEKAVALDGIRLLRSASRSILGGDVYFKCGEEIEVAYANWHSDPRSNEGADEFVERSCDEAKRYIEQFPLGACTPLFVLIVK